MVFQRLARRTGSVLGSFALLEDAYAEDESSV